MAPAKDPNQPKRGRNAYLIFTQERSAQIRRDQPTLGFGDVTREAAAQWKALSAEEKKPYEKTAAEEKDRYAEKMKDYTPSAEYQKSPGGKGKAAARKKKEKDPNAPKRPLTAYFVYLAEQRPIVKAENPTLGQIDIARIVGARWQAESADTQARYKQMAAAKAEADSGAPSRARSASRSPVRSRSRSPARSSSKSPVRSKSPQRKASKTSGSGSKPSGSKAAAPTSRSPSRSPARVPAVKVEEEKMGTEEPIEETDADQTEEQADA